MTSDVVLTTSSIHHVLIMPLDSIKPGGHCGGQSRSSGHSHIHKPIKAWANTPCELQVRPVGCSRLAVSLVVSFSLAGTVSSRLPASFISRTYIGAKWRPTNEYFPADHNAKLSCLKHQQRFPCCDYGAT
jgi:hypothetical protein